MELNNFYLDYPHQQRTLLWMVGAIEKGNYGKETSNEEEQSALPPRQCTVSQVKGNKGQLNELHFELLPHPLYSTDLALNDYYPCADCRKMLTGERF